MMEFHLEKEFQLLPRTFHYKGYLGVIEVEYDIANDEWYWHGYVTHLLLSNGEMICFKNDVSFASETVNDLEVEIVCSIQEYEESIYDSLI